MKTSWRGLRGSSCKRRGLPQISLQTPSSSHPLSLVSLFLTPKQTSFAEKLPRPLLFTLQNFFPILFPFVYYFLFPGFEDPVPPLNTAPRKKNKVAGEEKRLLHIIKRSIKRMKATRRLVLYSRFRKCFVSSWLFPGGGRGLVHACPLLARAIFNGFKKH